jgi:hypothetical protein
MVSARWMLCVMACGMSACALLESDPEFVDIGPCAGLNIEDSPACFASTAVFVAAGSDGDGSPERPMGSVTDGLLTAKTRGAKVVFIAGDHTLTQPIELIEGVSLLGGRDAATWQQRSAPSQLTMQLNGPVAIGLQANGIKTLTRVHHVTLALSDAPIGRQAQLGAQLLRSPGVLLDGVILQLGRGADGLAGATGTAGTAGGDGGDAGADGARSPGLGGRNMRCPQAAGSSGGTGATRVNGNNTAATAGELTPLGLPGGSPTQHGRDGARGEQGANGAAESASLIAEVGWQPGSAAQAGAAGEHGQGGSGGGGGDVVNGDGEGGGGGGGSAGGCGGEGGAPGQRGTDNIGVVVVGVSPELRDVRIEVGQGGSGGAGGQGGDSGEPGREGDMRIGLGGGRPGGAGGRGGAGGVGGRGGAGQGGTSVGVACDAAIKIRGQSVVILTQEGGMMGDNTGRARSGETWGCELP